MEFGDLPKRPVLPKYFHIVQMREDQLLLKTAGRTVKIRGVAVATLLPKLVPLLNGEHNISEIISSLNDFDMKCILQTLHTLYQKGLLRDAALKPSFEISPQELDFYEHQITFFSHFGYDNYKFQGDLRNSQVVVLGLRGVGSHVVGPLSVAGVGKIIGIDSGEVKKRDVNLGFFYLKDDVGERVCEVVQTRTERLNPYINFEGVERNIKGAEDILDLIAGNDFVIVCAENPLLLICHWVNKACLEEKVAWSQAYLDGFLGMVGPIVIPYQTACYTCYELRKRSNLDFYEENLAFEKYLLENPEVKVDYGGIKPLASIVGNSASLEIIKHFTGFSYPLTYSRLCKIDFLTLNTEFHEILKLPRCPSCGLSQVTPSTEIWSM